MGVVTDFARNIVSLIQSLGKKKKEEIDDDLKQMYTNIDLWRLIYANIPEWATYRTQGLSGLKTVERKLTSAAKIICAELASLIWSEQPQITVSTQVDEILKQNKFYEEMQKRIEYFAAFGGMAVKGYYDGDIKLDYVTAERFVPLSYSGSEITDAQFVDYRTYKSKKYIRLESYYKTETGYTITNELFDNDKNKVPLETIPELANLEPSIDIITDKKLFSYVIYPVANNLDTNSPLGLSMFANSIKSLEALDIAYDLLNDELVLGRKRIIVPESAMQAIFDPIRGEMDRYFDENDRVYQALHFDETESYKITDNSVELRVEDIVKAIDAHLRMIEFQTGFSSGTFSFDVREGFKTATEVISDNSKTFKTKQAAENQIDKLIKDSIEIIQALGELYQTDVPDAEGGNSILWDDSVIEDRNSKADYWIKLKNAGVATTEMAVKAIHGVTDEEAAKIAQDIRKEQTVFIDAGADADNDDEVIE